jgi:hypothetical protein
VPTADVLRVTVGDQKLLAAHATIVKLLFYYGTLVKVYNRMTDLPAEYNNMYNSLQTAMKLDPYNSDLYYFAEATFTWEVNRAKDVNNMLDYGMEYRTWDYLLPFFAGFNSAFFLKEPDPAARYMKKAAEISNHPLLTSLAARYFYEANQSELGVKFLEMMESEAKDNKIWRIYRFRRIALEAVISIQDAVKIFRKKYDRLPRHIQELIDSGILLKLPEDPYGGQFYLDDSGKVVSTSKFAYREQ